ncbi:MAG: hypothetical protein KC613_27200 [Myxococcales bacterium]|nr:hypothetical protein [Myxococcales bacterium]
MGPDRALNRLLLPLQVQVRTPLAVRAVGDDPLGAEHPIAQTLVGGVPVPYVPGSSLRGVLRAWAQRRLACLGAVALGDPSPLDLLPPAERHRRAPLEARLFGAPGLRGRIHVPDLLAWPAGEPPAEPCVPDRVQRVTPEGRIFEALAPGVVLYGAVVLTNFQTWQLGLVAHGLAALNRGAARLGAGGNHGLGQVHITHPGLVYEQPANTAELPLCLAELADADTAAAQGLLPRGDLPAKFGDVRGLSRRFEVPPEQVPEWLAAGLRALEALA